LHIYERKVAASKARLTQSGFMKRERAFFIA